MPASFLLDHSHSLQTKLTFGVTRHPALLSASTSARNGERILAHIHSTFFQVTRTRE